CLNGAGHINASDNKGLPPLMYAVFIERPAIVKLLLKRGANMKVKDHNGESALDWATKTDNEENIKLLSVLSSSGGKEITLKRLTEIIDEFSLLYSSEGKKIIR